MTTLAIRSPSPTDRSETMMAIAPHVQHMMQVWTQHVDDFGYTRTASDKMPRADAWRPYRFAVQDILLALVSMRHAKALNCIEIDVFLAADPCYPDLFMNRFFSSSKDGETTSEVLIIDENNVF